MPAAAETGSLQQVQNKTINCTKGDRDHRHKFNFEQAT
jgi:hypothetical protein